jgi:hypothetical protein
MSEVAAVRRLEDAKLVGGLSDAKKHAVAKLSDAEFEVLKSIRSRLDEAIGEDAVHRAEDGGLFW